jgi:beta-glucosidase
MCDAITKDGVNVTTYYAWSFIDNFEWRQAFHDRFGLVYVDLKTQERHPKLSAHWMSKHFFSRGK